MNRITSAVLSLFGLVVLVSSAVADRGGQQVLLSTGTIQGLYFPIGGSIAAVVNNAKATGLKIAVLPSAGSEANLERLSSGAVDVAIVQSDHVYRAYNGLGPWRKRGPQKQLRSIISLHSEPLTLVAGSTSAILGLRDVRGKRVNIGEAGSGSRSNAIDVLREINLNWKKDLLPTALSMTDAARALGDYEIDGAFFTIGHPNRIIRELTDGKRKVHFVPILGSKHLFNKHPYYTPAVIPAALYPGVTSTRKVRSIGVKALLVTTTRAKRETIYRIAESIFRFFKQFQRHPEPLRMLTKSSMLAGLLIPMHPGAKEFANEVHRKRNTK